MLLLFALLIIASLFATRISDKIGVPVLVVFLAVGLIVGSDVLGLIEFSDAKFTKQVAEILLIFILFDGGFRTGRSDLQIAAKPAITLASRISRFLFNHLHSENRGYFYVLIIGVILLGYGFADLIRANGIIAVFFMGYWLGNSDFVAKFSLFHGTAFYKAIRHRYVRISDFRKFLLCRKNNPRSKI